MIPLPECQVFVRLARNVQHIGIGKLLFVSVRRGDYSADHFPAADGHAGDRHVLARIAFGGQFRRAGSLISKSPRPSRRQTPTRQSGQDEPCPRTCKYLCSGGRKVKNMFANGKQKSRLKSGTSWNYFAQVLD